MWTSVRWICRGKALHVVQVRFFHHGQELARIGGQGFDIAPLPLSIQRIEGQRRLAGTRQTRDYHEFIPGYIQIDVFKIVGTCPADLNFVHVPPCVRTVINALILTSELPNLKLYGEVLGRRKI